ncbi:hypothetical protein Bca52824_034050 [Brassica carinata]|uniref:Uncharacterized protein n=1 Tax=Brassica carinata TaxID=52824 RepID=A0A8X7V7M4_BRACI|nr:hypothetical protein Bca52824_034050 [Brassica carinata]
MRLETDSGETREGFGRDRFGRDSGDLGRRSRSVPSSAAPPPFVDPEALMGQLQDKDDRISALETGWRLNSEL